MECVSETSLPPSSSRWMKQRSGSEGVPGCPPPRRRPPAPHACQASPLAAQRDWRASSSAGAAAAISRPNASSRACRAGTEKRGSQATCLLPHHGSMHGTHGCEGRTVVPRQARGAEPAVRGPCSDASAGVSLEAGAHDADYSSCSCCSRRGTAASRPSRRQRQRYHLLGGPPRPHAVRPVCNGSVPDPCGPGRVVREAPSEHLIENEASGPHVAGRRVGVPVLLVAARQLRRAPQWRTLSEAFRHGSAQGGPGAVVVDELEAAARAGRVEEEVIAPVLEEGTSVSFTE